MDEVKKFQEQVKANLKGISKDQDLQALSRIWIREATPYKFPYNFEWFGRPAIQFPNDAWALQEIVWKIQPDLIIECGIAHGGSLIYNASLMALLDYCDAVKSKKFLDPQNSKRKVLGIDLDIRQHNKKEIEAHPLFPMIEMIEGSSIDDSIITKVKEFSKSYKKIIVLLDSNHSKDHVLAELDAYAGLVSKGSYCIVYDTVIELMPETFSEDRDWGPGNGPLTAVKEFLKQNKDFEIDTKIDSQLLISVAFNGFLKKV